MKLAAEHFVLVDVGLDGQVLVTETEMLDALQTGAVEALEALLASLRHFLRRGRSKLLGVGVCVPGVVARPDVGAVDADVLRWNAVPLGSTLRRVFGVPVLVENDVKALAVAERLFGLGRDHHDFAVLTIGRGSASLLWPVGSCSWAPAGVLANSRTWSSPQTAFTARAVNAAAWRLTWVRPDWSRRGVVPGP